MIELNINDFFDYNNSVVIICYPTRVTYEAQTGGLACQHSWAEGFILIMQHFEIDDCSFGCCNLSELPEKRKELADLIHTVLIEETRGRFTQLEFDFSRLDDLQEGWWPVKIKTHYGYLNDELFVWTGWLHNGNCN